MSERQIPVFEPESESDEEKQKRQRLKTIFNDLESKQPDFLDEAGKSIIERIATFFAILFGLTALGTSFTPRYLTGDTWEKFLIIAILVCYLLAMGMGMWAIQPQNYKYHAFDITRQEEEWKRIVSRKKRWVRLAGLLFGLGTIALAGLIIAIIFSL